MLTNFQFDRLLLAKKAPDYVTPQHEAVAAGLDAARNAPHKHHAMCFGDDDDGNCRDEQEMADRLQHLADPEQGHGEPARELAGKGLNVHEPSPHWQHYAQSKRMATKDLDYRWDGDTATVTDPSGGEGGGTSSVSLPDGPGDADGSPAATPIPEGVFHADDLAKGIRPAPGPEHRNAYPAPEVQTSPTGRRPGAAMDASGGVGRNAVTGKAYNQAAPGPNAGLPGAGPMSPDRGPNHAYISSQHAASSPGQAGPAVANVPASAMDVTSISRARLDAGHAAPSPANG